ncbi:hypothetical protein Tco_0785128 [Tanacetum coccineum]
MLLEWRGIANMDFIKLGGSSRVLSDFCREVWEQKKNRVLAGERSGFAVEKVWGDIPVVTGFWGGKDGFRAWQF